MLVFALVLAVGTLEALRPRAGAARHGGADRDAGARLRGPRARRAAAAGGGRGDRLAREYLARNLATRDLPYPQRASPPRPRWRVAPWRARSDQRRRRQAPTVSIRATIPARVPLLNLIGLGPVVNVTSPGRGGADMTLDRLGRWRLPAVAALLVARRPRRGRRDPAAWTGTDRDRRVAVASASQPSERRHPRTNARRRRCEPSSRPSPRPAKRTIRRHRALCERHGFVGVSDGCRVPPRTTGGR